MSASLASGINRSFHVVQRPTKTNICKYVSELPLFIAGGASDLKEGDGVGAEEIKAPEVVPKVKKSHFSELKILVLRFEEGESQGQLVAEQCVHFLKPLVQSMSNMSLGGGLMGDERNDEVMAVNSLLDSHRPLNDIREKTIIRRRMDSTNIYVEKIKKGEG